MSKADWRVGQLQDLATIVAGPILKSELFTSDSNGLDLVRGETVGVDELRWNPDKRWPADRVEGYEQYLLQGGDIVLAMDGTLHRDGPRVAQLRESEAGALLVQRVARIRSKPGAEQAFLFALLRSHLFAEHVHANHTGTTISHISGKQLGALPVPIPSLAEQKRIAGVLEALDRRMRVLKDLESTVDQMLDGLFCKRFLRPLETPAGWREGTVGDLGRIVTGKTPSKKESGNFGGEIPFIKIPDLRHQHFVIATTDTLTSTGLSKVRSSELPSGAVLVSCIATVGEVGITTKASATNQQINAVIPTSNIPTAFVFYTLRHLRQLLNAAGSGGSVYTNVSKSGLSKIKVLMPPSQDLRKFDRDTSAGLAFLRAAAEERSTLDEIRATLLPRLVSGRVSVPDTYDPSGVLEECLEARRVAAPEKVEASSGAVGIEVDRA